MNIQFEILRAKNGIPTTVIKITKSSTTNDVMDWELIITNSFTKMVKNKKVSPVIIKKCFRRGLIGHKINICIFLFARRPVITVTVTATTFSKTIIEKIHSESEKKILTKIASKTEVFLREFGTKTG